VKILIAHPGTQYSYQLVKQLEKQGLLYRFYTGIAIAEGSILQKLFSFLPMAIQKKISNRIIEDVPTKKIRNIALPELRALRSIAKQRNSEDVFYQRNKHFQLAIPDSALQEADLVIGFDTSSWLLIDRCKQLGTKFILDVSIAHPASKQKVYTSIGAAYPSWNITLKNKPQYLIDLEQQELEKADAIVVASSFSKQTLIDNGIGNNKIFVNPYGVQADAFFPAIKKHQSIINFVFVGLVDARKGVPLLLDVWKKLHLAEATLTLIGPISQEVESIIKTSYPTVVVKGKVPFADLKQLMPKYDVLIFPSYFEGFGLVVLEAMAAGLPVITTNATCGPDLIDHEVDGIIMKTGNSGQLSYAIQSFIDNRYSLATMGKKTREKALKYSWEAYGERWKNLLIEFKIDAYKQDLTTTIL